MKTIDEQRRVIWLRFGSLESMDVQWHTPIAGKGDDRNINQLPVEDHKTMVGKRKKGNFIQVPHWQEDQGARRHSIHDREPRMASEVKTSLIAGACSILEGQVADSEAVSMADSIDLP